MAADTLWYPNRDGKRWGGRTSFAESPSVWLSNPDVQLADMDGDGASDVVARVSEESDGFRYYPSVGTEGGFGARVTITPNSDFALSDPDVRLVDLDHDRLTDRMRIDRTTGRVSVSFNDGGGAFTAFQARPTIDPNEVISFSGGAGAQFADMNGDGLSDIVVLRSGSLRYYPSQGFGLFDTAQQLVGAPTLSDGERAEIQVQDVNGDGLADLIHVGVSRLRVWQNRAGEGLAPAIVVDGVPSRTTSTVVRFADFNGNGSADIVWFDSASSTPWKYLDLLADGSPGLLTRIENGLGQVLRMEYAGIGSMRGWAEAEGVPWDHRAAFGQTLLRRLTTEDGIGPDQVTEFRYAGGYFHAETREFRGFAFAERRDLGSPEQPTLVTELDFDVGDTEEARKGLLLQTTRLTTEGSVFDEEESTYTTVTVGTSAQGVPLRYAYSSFQESRYFEGGDDPVTVQMESLHHNFGNEIRKVEYGRVESGDVRAWNDERVTERSFALNTDTWILDRRASETVSDLDGKRLSDKRTYYDGDAFQGLQLGQLERGDATREETWIEADLWGPVFGRQYDEYGNVVVAINQRGGRRETIFDHESHTFPVTEREEAESQRFLEWSVEPDRTHGGPLRWTDANGHASGYGYDALNRLVAIIAPDDRDDQSSRRFEYTYGNPLSFIREVRLVDEAAHEAVSYSYFDGLGRERGTTASTVRGMWVASDVIRYGARGAQQFVAYPLERGNADLPGVNEALGGTSFFTDALERQIREREPDGSERSTVYRPLERVVYDENDNDTGSPHYDTPTRYVEDGLGRLRRVVERDADREISTHYDYDSLGNLVRMQDALGRVRQYVYDGRSRRTEVHDPNAGDWSFVFSNGDDLLERHDPEGHRVRWEHDLLGRTNAEYHQLSGQEETPVMLWHYDEQADAHKGALSNTASELAWVEDEAGRVYFGYDVRGRPDRQLREWKDGQVDGTWTVFDKADRRIHRGFPDGTYLSMEYDDRDLLRSLGPVVQHFEWAPWKALARMDLGNGVVDQRAFDDRMRAVSMTAARDHIALRDLSFVYDRASQVEAMIDERPEIHGPSDLTAEYSYDDRYRLAQQITPRSKTNWRFDDAGNLEEVASEGESPLRSLAVNRMEGGVRPDCIREVDYGSEVESFTYDSAGRLTRDGTRTLTWDAKGRLQRVVTADAVEEYIYDYEDRRVLKTTQHSEQTSEVRYVDVDVEYRNGRLVRYAFAGEHRIARLDSLDDELVALSRASTAPANPLGAALVITSLVALGWLARRRIGSDARTAAALSLVIVLVLMPSCDGCDGSSTYAWDDPTEIRKLPASTTFYVNDHQGAPLVGLDVSGSVVFERAQDPFGKTRYETGSQDPFGFTGNEHDKIIDLGHFRARPYRYGLGVFLSPDPVSVFDPVANLSTPRDQHPYTYGGGDPIARKDESGLQSTSVLGKQSNLSFGFQALGIGWHASVTATREAVYAPSGTSQRTKFEAKVTLAFVTLQVGEQSRAGQATTYAKVCLGPFCYAGTGLEKGLWNLSEHSISLEASVSVGLGRGGSLISKGSSREARAVLKLQQSEEGVALKGSIKGSLRGIGIDPTRDLPPLGAIGVSHESERDFTEDVTRGLDRIGTGEVVVPASHPY